MSIPAGPDLEYARGDMAPLAVIVKQSGAQFNWAGYTEIEITINSEKEPTDATNQVGQLAGTPRATDGSDGTVDFVPPDQSTSDNYTPGSYFYDMTALDGSSRKVTLFLGGKFKIRQDINKD